MAARSGFWFAMTVIAADLWSATTVRSDAAGDAVVAAVDTALNRASTLIIDYDIQNQRPLRMNAC